MSLTTLAERILLMTPESGFDCACGDCTWCRLVREAKAAGMSKSETPPDWARRFVGSREPQARGTWWTTTTDPGSKHDLTNGATLWDDYDAAEENASGCKWRSAARRGISVPRHR